MVVNVVYPFFDANPRLTLLARFMDTALLPRSLGHNRYPSSAGNRRNEMAIGEVPPRLLFVFSAGDHFRDC